MEYRNTALGRTELYEQLARIGKVVMHKKRIELLEGTRVYYRAAGEEVCCFTTALGDLARARLAEVTQILRGIGLGMDVHGTERVTRAELLQRVGAGDVIVIDVRAPEEYAAGHIAGAISLPLEHLEARLDEWGPELERYLLAAADRPGGELVELPDWKQSPRRQEVPDEGPRPRQ